MTKNKLLTNLAASIPQMRRYGSYFIHPNFEYVLSGLMVEFVPGGIYLWDFQFPLFDFFGPHLTFSKRLEKGTEFLSKDEFNSDTAEVISSIPEVRELSRKQEVASVEDFVIYLEGSPDVMRNMHSKFIYCSALILSGRTTEGKKYLDSVRGVLSNKYLTHIADLDRCIVFGSNCPYFQNVRRRNLDSFKISET